MEEFIDTEEDLSSRNLTELPKAVLENKNLVNLFIDYNDLENLPEDFGSSLPSLKLFSAIGNSLTSFPQSVGNQTQIQEIYLNENDLVSLPNTFCNLKCLVKLKLTGNKMESLPENFGELTALEILNCDENILTRLPKTFGLLENLKVLELGCNSIASLSEGFGKLTALQVLNLSSNKLKALPDSFGDLPDLRTLDLSANEIKFLPSHFKSVHCLQKMYADSNLLQILPEWVSDLQKVEEFSVKDNQFQHQTLPDIFPKVCQKLKHLDMSGNFMSKLPETLGQLQALEFLHLGSVIGELERRNFQNGNWLAEIPDSICCLKHLTELNVDENQLSELPTNFGDLVSLEILDLGQNLLHELPESFGNLGNLRICLLSKNHLQWLPSNFGHLSSLEDLRLDDNELAELPESFSELHKLKTLDLFSNRLTQIPAALRHLKSLVRLDIDHNDFQLPLTDVPQIITKSKYPERDPNLKDNWRGRPRQDLTNLDDQIIKAEGCIDIDFEPPPPSLNYNEDFLMHAMERNMSIWKSHADTSTGRRPSRRRTQHRRYDTDLEVEVDDDDDDDLSDEEEVNDEDDDDNFEPPVIVEAKTWSGSTQSSPPTTFSQTNINVKAMLEETECWDEEIDEPDLEQYDNVPVYQSPTKMYYAPVENGQFTFAPFDIHELDYVKRPLKYSVEDGQFENCDGDETEEAEGCTDIDFEPPQPTLNYNEDFLMHAMERNMSIWKSHADTTTGRRPSSRRTQYRRYDTDLEVEVDDDDDDDDDDDNDDLSDEEEVNDEDDDDNFEPPVIGEAKTWSGSTQSSPPTTFSQTNINVKAMLEETECWDEEIDEPVLEQYDNVPVYQSPTKMYYAPVENGQFTFAPYDIHELDYVKRPLKYSVEDGQFENCDGDETEEVKLDPVF